MKQVLRGAVLLLCLSGAALAEGGGHPWIRRAMVAASCAASVWDLQSTRAAVSQGAVEANGFLAGPYGRPRWGRMIGIKAGICGGSVLGEVLWGRRHEVMNLGVNTTFAGVFTVAAIHNYQVRNRLAAKRDIPAWLAP